MKVHGRKLAECTVLWSLSVCVKFHLDSDIRMSPSAEYVEHIPDSTVASTTSQRYKRFVLGVFVLILVDLIWVVSAEISEV